MAKTKEVQKSGANGRTSGSSGRVEGEGSYSATRAYNKNLARAVSDKGSMERGAERARRALEGAEGPSLREAEKRAKGGPRPRAARAR
jgi:hypothetical protein